MPNTAISAQGTLVARAPAGGSPLAFVTIGDLEAITPPPETRNEIETTSHNETEETFVVGILRKGPMTLSLGWKPSNTTHGPTSGLQKAIRDGSLDGYRITYPDGWKFIFSGYVTNVGPSAPVDDKLVADVTIRPSGSSMWVAPTP